MKKILQNATENDVAREISLIFSIFDAISKFRPKPRWFYVRVAEFKWLADIWGATYNFVNEFFDGDTITFFLFFCSCLASCRFILIKLI